MNNQKFEIETGVVCPKCGSKSVQHAQHLTYPPQDHYECPKCGAHKDIKQELPPVEIAPFN